MIIGGTDSDHALATYQEPVASFAVPAAPMAATAVAASTGGGSAGVDPARRQALMTGASPVTAAEQAWLSQTEQALRSYIQIVGAAVAEGSRQAQLGRDINGQPLPRAEDHAFEQRVLELVNVERARNGLGALGYDARLDAASEAHNRQQAAVGVMSHDAIGDGDPGARIQATGFNRSWGENVAAGQLSPEQVVAEWMASPGHRRNILDPEFHLLGVSYAVAADGRTYWAQSFGA